MKKYIVERAYEENEEAFNLVNVEDSTDYIMVAADEFKLGETVMEGTFFIEECNYVDDQGTGTGYFAFKVNK